MAEDDAKTWKGGSTGGARRGGAREAMGSLSDPPGDTARLAGGSSHYAAGLELALIRVARGRIAACAALMANAEAAFEAQQEDLAIDAVLDTEPLLHETQVILTATTMLRRIVREADSAKT